MNYGQEMAAAGLPVFPLRANKRPRPGSHGFHDASADADVVAAWGDAPLWGVRTGEQSGLCALDLDPPEGEALPAFAERVLGKTLADEVRAARAPFQRTKRGGVHMLFAHARSKCIGQGQNIMGKDSNVDGRCEGGYIVAWQPDAIVRAVADAPMPPVGLLEAVRRPVVRVARPVPEGWRLYRGDTTYADSGAERYADTALRGMRQAVEGGRRDAVFFAARALFRLEMAGRAKGVMRLIEADARVLAGPSRRGRPAFTEGEVRREIQSAYKSALALGPLP